MSTHFRSEHPACNGLAFHGEEKDVRGATAGIPRFTDRRFCALLAVWCFVSASSALASAPNVYIAQNAAGSANGSSCANAYAVSFFNSSANWGSATTQIGPGTVVNLCGTLTGIAGATALTFQGSGVNGNPITLLFQPGAALNAPYWGTNIGSIYNGAINTGGQSYIVINGQNTGSISATANGSSLPYQANSAGIYVSGGSNVTVENLAISNMYVHVANSSTSGGNANTVSAGIQVNGSNSFKASGNTIHDATNGIFVGYGTGFSGITVSDNTIYNCNWGVAGGDNNAGSSLAGLYVYGNNIHDAANWNDSADNYHHNGIYFWAEQSSGSTITSAFFYNNKIYGDYGGSNCTAGIFMSQGGGDTITSPYFFNNVIDQSTGSGVCGNGAFSLNVGSPHFYNNTILEGYIDGPNGPIGNGVYKNNIYSSPSGSGQGIYDTTAGLSASDYNVWYSLGSYSMIWNNNGGFNALPAWTAGTGFDAHSITSNPNLTFSYQPNSGSPVIGAAANLYSVCNGQPNPGLGALCYDMNGVARPTSTAWDAGAFQFGTAADVYSLSVVNGSGSGAYALGAVAAIAANTPPPGQAFLNWTGAAVQNSSALTTTLTMPGSNATVTANYTAPTLYALTVANGTGGGTYAPGTVVTIAADAAPARQAFLNWTGATVASSTSATTTLTMPAASATVTANYTPTLYALTVANGTGGGTYAPGTVVTIAADATPSGQTFLNWTGATVASSTSAATTLTMPAATTTITANYAAVTLYALTVANGGGGGSYASGTVVTITANAPPSGQAFLDWTGATVASSTSATTTLSMPAASTTVTANYTKPTLYALTVANGTGGGTYASGTVVTITAYAPPSGQAFLNWTGATVANSASTTTTLTMPAASATVTANYTYVYALTVNNGTGNGRYAPGTVVTIKASAPPSGEMFMDWTGATVANSTAATTTLTMPASPVTAVANYRKMHRR